MTKILLVEDDKSLREIYGVRLLAEGYDIVSAGDGEEALAMAIKERPQLIVSDVMMPKISGFDMLDILRSTTETKNIKVIMMTALSSDDQRERGESLGADRYLVKSQVGIEDVVRTVHEVLGDAPSAPSTGNVFAQPAGPRTSTPTAPGRPAAHAGPTAAPSAPSTGNVFAQPAPTQPSAPPQQPSQAPPQPATPQPTATNPAPATRLPADSQPAPAPSAQTGNLPQPTAPFSTNRPAGLGDRIIHPIDQPSTAKQDFGNLMAQELNSAAQAAPAQQPSAPPQQPSQAPPQPAAFQPQFQMPAAPQIPQQPSQPAAAPQPATPSTPNISFEETPRPNVQLPQQ